METKCIDIEGNQVIDLTPDYNRPLALVDAKVLKQLTDLLPRNNFSGIRHTLRERIMKAENLEELVRVTEDFTAFHKSVSFIREVCQREIQAEKVVVGQIDLDDIDTCARDHTNY